MPGQRLTRNQRRVLDALTAAGKPRCAYTVLDALRDAGLRTPLRQRG